MTKVSAKWTAHSFQTHSEIVWPAKCMYFKRNCLGKGGIKGCMGVLIGLSTALFLFVSGIPIYMIALLFKKIRVRARRSARSAEIEALRQLWGRTP